MQTLVISPLVAIVIATTALCGCAGTAPTRTSDKTAADKTARVDCTELNAQLISAHQRKSAAAAAQRDAWKVVIPVAVVARYAGAIVSANDADEEIARLQADLQRAGCAG